MTTRRRWFAVLVLPAWVMVGCSSNSEEETVPTGSEPDASVDSTTQPDTATENSVDSPVQDSSTTDSGEDASPDVQQEAATDAGADAASDAAADSPPLEKYCDNPEPGFDPANPGIHFWFDIGTVVLMGQSAALGAGGFQPTVREDYCNEPKGFDIPLDSCTDQPAPAVLPQCSNKSDCAPEQDCVQRTDSQGTPIEGSEYCATPYSMLDVGPFAVTGFATGPREFTYNASQSGAYTSTADGSLPFESIAFDTDYQIAGDGSPDAGLGAYSGSFHFPADFQLTAPPTVPVGRMGLAGLEIDPTQDLTLEWVGGDPNAVLEITMSGPPNAGATVTCKARNDGSFTIPAAMVQAVGFGTAPIFNMLDMRLGSTGKASGTGITISRVSITQALTRNIKTL